MLNIIFIKKKKQYDVFSKSLLSDLTHNLHIKGLQNVNFYIKYLVSGIDENTMKLAIQSVFSEAPVDIVYFNVIKCSSTTFAYSLVPGQFDQRADSAEQCIRLINPKSKPIVKTAKVVELIGKISTEDFNRVKQYLINPVDSCEVNVHSKNISNVITKVKTVDIIKSFNKYSNNELKVFYTKMNFSMSFEDLLFVQKYFIKKHKNPTATELKVIDTYWSDHCRHTTFETIIDKVQINGTPNNLLIKNTYDEYVNDHNTLFNVNSQKPFTLMDIATINAKLLKKEGKLKQLDISDEINACSINVDVLVGKLKIPYLLMFKNETHNHPTEIEPFGGAATCLGGAIRDPLSGRAYVYQAMRISGAADPTVSLSKTLPNKLSQKTIVIGAANGYSSYGNQIGLATGQVHEIYHPQYAAKHLELGAVIAAVPKKNIFRSKPVPGDVIILLGGDTGRDGIGGATGSSKSHTIKSVNECSAEVQKGNPICERKIQRLFLNKNVTSLIKKCNDFGAGGVCVAIGELCNGVDINLNDIPVKYQGLSATDLAISESQERMAVVVSKQDAVKFIKLSQQENLKATIVASVTNTNCLRMFFNKKLVVNIDRDFLNTNGIKQHATIQVPDLMPIKQKPITIVEKQWQSMLTDLNVCNKQGLIQMFDASIGCNTVLWPLGGEYKLTPSESMVALIPSFQSIPSQTCSIMSYGFEPTNSELSCFHMGYYSVIESVSKCVASGGCYQDIYLSMQEYFPKLKDNPKKWAQPFLALLGAYKAQKDLKIAAIGGKDSMSGSYEKINVVPTLVAFSVTTEDVKNIISPEFKMPGAQIVLIEPKYNKDETIDASSLTHVYDLIHRNIINKNILSAMSLKSYGIAHAITKMCFGNKLGCDLINLQRDELFLNHRYGSFILEIPSNINIKSSFPNCFVKTIGTVTNSGGISINQLKLKLQVDKLCNLSDKKLQNIYPFKTLIDKEEIPNIWFDNKNPQYSKKIIAHPLVVIPVFPGTNCEYDTEYAFLRCGAKVQQVLIKNQTSNELLESIKILANWVKKANILVIPGGFSAADEPDGSAKFIVNIFQNQLVKEATHQMLDNDGLMLGICNGFQALIKLGLLQTGRICSINEESPTLTYNKISHHISDIVLTKVVSTKSPWLNLTTLGSIKHTVVSHGEGNFICSPNVLSELVANNQIALQYVDTSGKPTYKQPFNPNGSTYAIEAVTSKDGRILGKMGHCERIGGNLYKNVPGDYDLKLFESGVAYFTHKQPKL